MGDDDWMGEMMQSMGDPAHRAPDADLAAAGSGRDFDGWIEELNEALGIEGSLDAITPMARPASLRPLGSTDPEVLDRLVRIERLLGADLDKLGPALLADSVAAIQSELQSLETRLAQIDEPHPPAPVVVAPAEPVVIEPDLELRAQVGALAATINRLDGQLTSQAQLLAELTVAPAPADDTLEQIVVRIDALAALAEGPLPPDPAIARLAELLDRRFARIEAQLEAQLEALDEVHRAALEPAPEPVPAVVADEGATAASLEALTDAVVESVRAELSELGAGLSRAGAQRLEDLVAQVERRADRTDAEVARALASRLVEGDDGDVDGDHRPAPTATSLDLVALTATITGELDRMRRDFAGRRADVDIELLDKSVVALGRRIVSLEQLTAAAIAVDERTEQRLRELIERLDELTTNLLG